MIPTLALHEALSRPERDDERAAFPAKLRTFTVLSRQDAIEALRVRRGVRLSALGPASLFRELSNSSPTDSFRAQTALVPRTE